MFNPFKVVKLSVCASWMLNTRVTRGLVMTWVEAGEAVACGYVILASNLASTTTFTNFAFFAFQSDTNFQSLRFRKTNS